MIMQNIQHIVKSKISIDMIIMMMQYLHTADVIFINKFIMAKNPSISDGHRIEAVRERSQMQTPSGYWVKRNANNGRFMDVKTTEKTPFKRVRKEK